jgi:hypothetical protein
VPDVFVDQLVPLVVRTVPAAPTVTQVVVVPQSIP